MIISSGRRYIFVHAPKTGGTAMALALEARAMKDDIFAGDTPKAKARTARLKDIGTKKKLTKHSMLAELDGYLSPEDLRGYFVFTLVRNPWDRMVSYYHWLRDQTFDHPAVILSKGLNFEGFVAHPTTHSSMQQSSFAHYVTDAEGCERCDLFIRLEHLAEDIALLEAHLGFALNMPHANASRRKTDFRDYYTDESRARVAAMSEVDIARFDYRFE